ncbi:MAG: 1-acyl-sn-glycerol-3-phosphate acyltransferase [Rhizobacter sp.]|nr:1-acyl-sn-glycerol-3-phosphate acyltransferase [Rhizobacter sp.]
MKLLRQLIAGVFFYVALLGLGIFSLAWNLLSYALYPLLPRRRAVVIGRAAISSGYRFFWGYLVLTGVMRLDYGELDVLNQDAGLIIAGNHPSALDALLVIAKVPRGVCIMRTSLMYNPFLGAGARLARYIRNTPPSGMVRGAVRDLREGGQLLMFPEGTRTITPPVNKFLPGMTLIAHMAKVPIQTVIIEAESRYLGKGWPIWRPPHFPMVFRVRLGQRFAHEADHKGLLTRLEAYFAGELSKR